MGWRLAEPGDAIETGFIKRFDPRFWSVNFPRPMMAAVTTPAPDALRVDASFLRRNDLAGIIWAAEDSDDHPLLAYETARDFRGCVLRFRWRSAGVRPLDAVDGPVLTIEGRDADGAPRAWYVRLWNYAEGGAEDAAIRIDFADVAGGFALPGEADPVWAGDVDRMFLSLVAPGHDGADAPLAAAVDGWVELSGMACDGPGSVLAIGDAIVPAHGFRIATGYDDLYHLTPARVLRNIVQLGYAQAINHYVGMSHYPRLGWNAAAGKYLAGDGGLCGPCITWHRDFAGRAQALGQELIWSLSYELLDQHCPEDWKQRAENGDPALTGWAPPSTLLSPANGAAMAWLRDVARAFVAIAVEAGMPVRFQIGEPWWWVVPGEGRICLYDDAARAALGGPVSIPDVRGPLDAGQRALLDRAGEVLAESTLSLRDAVKGEAAGAEVLILVYLPTVLDRAAPELKRANVPLGWARPAFDRLQLEDYDWVTAGDTGSTARGLAEMGVRLGYPIAEQHYFAGFVLRGEDRHQWRAIHDAAQASRRRGTAETFVWALPQVLRDGFT
ncbi:MAG: non-contractile tail sheath protein, partial [Sphingomonadaceae bacterium]